MSEKNENRWWENYLVRYLVPSIAGMFILMWLNKNLVGSGIVEAGVIKLETVKTEIVEVSVISNETVKAGILEQYLPMLKLTNGKDFNTASLTVWLLLGTLYCYIASYPILVLHAVRVHLFNISRISCILRTLFVLFILLMIGCMIYYGPYFKETFLIPVFVIILSISQCYFLYRVAKVTKVGMGYAYMESLTEAKNPATSNTGKNIVIPNTKKNVVIPNVEKDAGYIKDITDSYKHLREHGNTALIILLEILLAFILYFSLRFERKNGYMDFSIVSIILIIWIFPAALVYFYGHLLERKFSEFDNKENK